VVRVFAGGKVTVPKQLREWFGVAEGDYVRLVLVEFWRKGTGGNLRPCVDRWR
jgi:bifunctional DNA-binding transcriptional regulator/antitoxin component of YhaV-PrlF toxin-antitoxin module